MITPNDIAIRTAVAAQSQRINRKLDRIGVPTAARRANVRAKGYRGPLTRAELAKRVSNA